MTNGSRGGHAMARITRGLRRLLPVLLCLPLPGVACRTPVAEPDLEAMVEALLPRLEARSGLRAIEPIRVERRDEGSLRAYLVDRLDQELPAEEMAGIEATYQALGLLPDTLDLRSLLLELYTEQVIGHYDPATATLYVMEGVPADALEPVLVHELVHAIQDQHADLDSLISRERGNDRQVAAHAAIEGHATVVMFELLLEEQAGQQVDVAALPDLRAQLAPMIQAGDGTFPVFEAAPRLIRETLLFPYIDGAAFVQALWRERPERPPPFHDWLPLSSAQVRWPMERYFPRPDPPRELVLNLPPPSPWRVLREDNLGSFEIGILLAEHLGEEARDGSAGWTADVYRTLEDEEGRRAIVLYSAWIDAAAADGFADAYGRILAERAERRGTVQRLELEGQPAVLVVDVAPGLDPSDVPVPSAGLAAEAYR